MKKFLSISLILLLSIVIGITLFVKASWNSTSALLNTNASLSFTDLFDTNRANTNTTPDTLLAPAPFDGWKFVVIGDTEDGGPVLDRFISDMKQRSDITFIAHVGDIVSHGDTDLMKTVKSQFSELPIPTYYVPGNNDLIYNEKTERKTLEHYAAVFGSPAYQAVTVQNAQLFFLDNSYLRIGFADDELAWLKKTLDDSSPQYRFLFFHRPLNVPGQEIFGDDETPNSRIQNTKFLTLLSNYHIDRIFNGHIHTSLNYTLTAGDTTIPVTVSGGGGAYPQAILGGEAAAYFHYLVVTVPNEPQKTPHIQIVKLSE